MKKALVLLLICCLCTSLISCQTNTSTKEQIVKNLQKLDYFVSDMEAELLQNTATALSFRYQEIYEESFSFSISGGYFATDDPGDFADSDFICLEFPDKDHAILAKELFLAARTEEGMADISIAAPSKANSNRYCRMYSTREITLQIMIALRLGYWKLRRKKPTAARPTIKASVFMIWAHLTS
jgi:hypothetical protein